MKGRETIRKVWREGEDGGLVIGSLDLRGSLLHEAHDGGGGGGEREREREREGGGERGGGGREVPWWLPLLCPVGGVPVGCS